MSVNYSNYQIFYYVAENRNITAAANQLYLSPSTVSRAIQAMERELECTLMLRSKQGITLTEQGNYLYSYVKKAFTQISFAENHLSNTQKLNNAFLKIGAIEFTLKYFLVYYLVELEKDFPNIHMSLSFESPQTTIDRLNNGQLDIAIMATPFEGSDPNIKCEPLKAFRSILVASPERKRLLNRQVGFKELCDEPFIGMNEGSSTNLYMQQIFDEYQLNISPKYVVCSGPAIISMVKHNLGIGIIPEILAKEEIDNGGLVEVQLEKTLPMRQICALTSKVFPVHVTRDMFLSKILS